MDLSFLHCQNLPSQSQSQTTQPQPPHCSTRFVCICLVSFLITVVRTIVVYVICLCSNFFYGIVDGFGSKILGEELPLALLAKQVRQIESIRNYIGGLQTNFYFYFFSISTSFPFLCFSECVTNLTNSITVTNFIALNFFHMHLLPPLVSLLVNGVYLCWHEYLLV